MADGDISLDASGNRILDTDGNQFVKCCCDDGEDPDADKYIQARRCTDGVDVDLWFPPGTTLPFYFRKTSVDYYINSGCNKNVTHGTLAAGYTTSTGCPANCCTSGTTYNAPSSVILTISGAAECPVGSGCSCYVDECAGGADAANGAHTLPLVEATVNEFGGTCHYRLVSPASGPGFQYIYDVVLFNTGSGVFVQWYFDVNKLGISRPDYTGDANCADTSPVDGRVTITPLPSGACSGSATKTVPTYGCFPNSASGLNGGPTGTVTW